MSYFFFNTGIRDHSGLKIHMTPTVREHDIGIMSVGVVVDEGMIIPPHFESLTYIGQCKSDCLHKVKRPLCVSWDFFFGKNTFEKLNQPKEKRR